MKSTILIEKYLDGTLKGNKLKDFEKNMNNSDELKKLVIIHKEVNESIECEDVIRFRNKLDYIYSLFRKSENHKEKDSVIGLRQQNKVGLFVKYRLLIAASISLFIIIGALFFYMLKAKEYTNDELFSMYYQPYTHDISRGSDSHILSDLESAIILYDNFNYQQAHKEFSFINEQYDENYLAKFYYGLTCIEMEEFDKAIQQFENILENWESPFVYHAEWYLLLCYLKNNNKEKALILLQTIEQGNKYYKKRAEEILHELS